MLLYPFTSLLAEFGGCLGLFLGFSFITVSDGMKALAGWLQRRKNPKLSGKQLSTRKNFPDETVSHDKPKKRAFASRDIAKECVMNVLGL